jgi:hypothetical protein
MFYTLHAIYIYAPHACYYILNSESKVTCRKKSGYSYRSSQESADSERWEDNLGEILGGTEACGRPRGISYGAPWKEYLPESPQLAKLRRRSKKESDLEFK